MAISDTIFKYGKDFNSAIKYEKMSDFVVVENFLIFLQTFLIIFKRN